jgi:1-acyl-sn-glycerol-3-phosphate acyltransferase
MSLYGFIKTVLRPTTSLLFDAKVSGSEHVPPTGPLIVASNHLSYWDPPILGTWFPRTIHFMAKRELWKMGPLGSLISAVHAFPVDRESADIGAIRHALRVLKDGAVVGIFPEGRRNQNGDLQARSGAVLLAATAHCPIVPVALIGTNVASTRLRKSHVEVRIGEPLRFQGTERKPTKNEISAWTQVLASKIADLMEKNADSKSSDPGILLRR